MSKQVHFDFDQFMAEREGKPIVIRIFGQDEELPPSLPADLVVKVMALHRKGVKRTSEKDILELGSALFGEERFNRFLKQGITMAGLEALIENTLKLYVQTPEDGNTQPNDEAEN